MERDDRADGDPLAGDDAAEAGWFSLADMASLDITGTTLAVAREIAAEISAHLEARQDVLLAMAITEDGVAAGKVVSSLPRYSTR